MLRMLRRDVDDAALRGLLLCYPIFEVLEDL